MIVTFLGTAAAEGYPNPFCRCRNCETARALGGPSLRKRSAVLINDDLLIDLGPDIVAASQLHGRSLAGLRFCLQTHSHSDHLDPAHFLHRSPEFGLPGAPRLHFYAHPLAAKRTAQIFAANVGPAGFLEPAFGERLNLEVHQVEALQSFTAGPYRVTSFPANHDPTAGPLLFSIRSGGRSIFYGVDTGPLPGETWQTFHRLNLRFDVVILDHTYGTVEGAGDHLNARQFVEHLARMREEGLLSPRARLFAHHLAHDSNPPHPQLMETAAERGYEVAYDGLTV